MVLSRKTKTKKRKRARSSKQLRSPDTPRTIRQRRLGPRADIGSQQVEVQGARCRQDEIIYQTTTIVIAEQRAVLPGPHRRPVRRTTRQRAQEVQIRVRQRPGPGRPAPAHQVRAAAEDRGLRAQAVQRVAAVGPGDPRPVLHGVRWRGRRPRRHGPPVRRRSRPQVDLRPARARRVDEPVLRRLVYDTRVVRGGQVQRAQVQRRAVGRRDA